MNNKLEIIKNLIDEKSNLGLDSISLDELRSIINPKIIKNLEDKNLKFEYFVFSLLKYCKENNLDTSELNSLHILLLLFFTVSHSSNKQNKGLLIYFDNFHAYPFGHIEKDIYDAIDNDSLFCYKIGKTIEKKLDDYEIQELLNEISYYDKAKINEAIINLFFNKKHLIEKPCNLYDLSRKYYSFSSCYNMAQSINKNSMKIGNSIIQKEPKFYKLNY